MKADLIIRDWPLMPYQDAWQAMTEFTKTRSAGVVDELWLLEHPPVFTQGSAGKPEHLLNPGDIPVVQSDRGGQVTYHGPGQLVVYTLFDLRRLNIGIRKLVTQLESVVMDTLARHHIMGNTRPDAPGVYVDQAKICSIGLRVRQGCAYHGIALNVAMDTTPFTRINPCGFEHLSMAQMRDWIPDITVNDIKTEIIPHICRIFGYNHPFSDNKGTKQV